jgi:hypothetical protein
MPVSGFKSVGWLMIMHKGCTTYITLAIINIIIHHHNITIHNIYICLTIQIVLYFLFTNHSPAQLTKIDSLHYRTLRQIFQIKNPYYHRVLQPPDSLCSNEYLLSRSYPVLPSCIPSSIRISDSRIKYLGHIIRHPTSPEFHIWVWVKIRYLNNWMVSTKLD